MHDTGLVMRARWRRAAPWLVVTAVLHLGCAVSAVLLATNPALTAALAVGPLVGLRWFDRGAPYRWGWVSFGVACAQAIGLGAAVGPRLGGPPTALLLLGFASAATGAAVLARRALVAPPVTGLGATGLRLEFPLRAVGKPWWYSDVVVLSANEVEVHVSSGSGRRARPVVRRIALADITGVGVREGADEPWTTLADGRGLPVPPGPVAVVDTREGERLLPVAEPEAFAEVLRERVAEVTGRRPAAPPAPAPRADGDGHLPELLPAPPDTGPRVHAARGPEAVRGRGAGFRWAVAGPLGLIAVAVLPLGFLVTYQWAAGTHALPADWTARTPSLTAVEFAMCAGWTAIAVVVWLLCLRRPRFWGRIALLPAPVLLFWVLAASLRAYPGRPDGLAGLVATRAWLWALLVVVAAPLPALVAGRVLRRPVALDLAATRVEVPIPVGGGDTLMLQEDRLVLRFTGGRPDHGGLYPQAVWLREVTLVQAGERQGADVAVWPLPGGIPVRVWPGPALRVVAGRQQWVLSVQRPEVVARLIEARARVAGLGRAHADALDLDRWRASRDWAASRTTGTDRGRMRTSGIGWRLVAAAALGWIGWVLLTAWLGGAALGAGVALAAVFLAVPAGLVLDWLRVRARLREAEHHALPPTGPTWGETRPDHAPVDGWRPWA